MKYQVNYCSKFLTGTFLVISDVLMSRSKTSTSKSQGPPDNSSFVSQTTANTLLNANLIDYCLTLLKELLEYWKR